VASGITARNPNASTVYFRNDSSSAAQTLGGASAEPVVLTITAP
jgi:hypothetical protein